MSRVLLINTAEPEEARVALVVDGRLEEYARESAPSRTLVGNIYKGRVVNLEAGIGAAFVEIGGDRNAFLHVSDCVGAAENDRIAEHFRVGDTALVQVTRDSIGEKGPVLTSLVTLPGRYVVLLPHAKTGGVSRRIEGRSRLRTLVRELEQEAGMGIILRTIGGDGAESELRREIERLCRVWARVQRDAGDAQAPALLHAHADLVGRAVRDVGAVDEIVVDTADALARAGDAARTVDPELEPRLRSHDSERPLFHDFGVERQVDELRERRVALPGGGSLVIDTTEALVAVDVNSGRTRHENGLEETALQTNLEAAEEVARQIRLRDLGGVIVVDFIDMKVQDHLTELESAFRNHLKRDPVHLRPGRLGDFCIFVLTRQRAGGGALSSMEICRHCGGAGALAEPEQVALRVWRELLAGRNGPVRAQVRADVADALRAMRGEQLAALRPAVSIDPTDDVPPIGWRI